MGLQHSAILAALIHKKVCVYDSNKALVRIAHGRILRFVDDDATLDPGWVQAAIESFSNARIGAATGFVRIPLEKRNADYVPEELRRVLGGTYWGSMPRYVASAAGINLCVRADTFS